MAKGVTFKLEGFKELEAALMQLDNPRSRKTVVRNALKKAAEPIKAAMEAKAPVDDGELKSNIVVGTKLKSDVGNAAYSRAMTQGFDKAAAVRAMRDARRTAKATMPPVIMYVGPGEEIYYSHLVEFGTAPHTLGGMFAGAQHPGTSPRPFIRPAWDENKEAALKIISDEMRIQLNKAFKRQANARAKKAKAGG